MDSIRLRLSAASTTIIVRDNWLVIESSDPAELKRELHSISGDKLLSVSDISERTGFTAGAVRAWIKSGKLTGIRVGTEFRVKEGDLTSFLQSTTGQGSDPAKRSSRRRRPASF